MSAESYGNNPLLRRMGPSNVQSAQQNLYAEIQQLRRELADVKGELAEVKARNEAKEVRI
jgi:AmiR/NasT family two-component response regulator